MNQNVLPKVSALMCVYNGDHSLASAIESILGQSYADFEFVIVDDGSTDDTLSLLLAYAAKDARIRVVRQENQGLTRALNTGLRACRGEYVARQDADDLSCPDRLRQQVAVMEAHDDVVLVGSDYEVIDDDGEHLVDIHNSRKSNVKQSLVKSNPYAHGCIMFRRVIDGEPVMYDEFYYKAQDRDLIFRLSECGELYTVPEILYSWRFSRKGILATNVTFYGTRATQNYLRRQQGLDNDYTPPTEDEIRAKPSEAHLLYSLGVRLLSGYRTGAARKAFMQAANKYGFGKPGFLRAIKMLLVTFIPVPVLRCIRER